MALDNFIPEIWSSELLVNLHNSLVYGSSLVANHDYQGEISDAGDTVRINSIGAVSVTDYTKNTDHAAADALTSAQTVLAITEAKMFNFQVDDIDAAQQNPKVMGAAMREAAFSLGNTMDGFLSAAINTAVPTGNKVNSGTAIDITTAGNAYEALVDLGTVLDSNNAPTDGRWAVVSPKVFGLLLKDQRFVSFGTDPNRASLANRAVGGNVAGFTIMVSNQTPKSSSDDVVLAGHNWAVTVAEQINKVEGYRPQLRFADAVKGLHLYGAKVVRPELTALAVFNTA
jgi:hypothetical protein